MPVQVLRAQGGVQYVELHQLAATEPGHTLHKTADQCLVVRGLGQVHEVGEQGLRIHQWLIDMGKHHAHLKRTHR